MDDAFNKLEQSIEKREFASFLMGEKTYAFSDPWTESPTDIGHIFIQGCNQYVKSKNINQQKLTEEFHHAFLTLLKSPEGTWWTISIIYSYFFAFLDKSLLFKIDVEAIIPNINESLTRFEANLRSNRQWVGWRFHGGLWDDISQMARRINEKLDKKIST